MPKVIVIGAGGHGRSVAESILAQPKSVAFELVGFVDDAFPKLRSVWEYPVLGDTKQLSSLLGIADAAIVAVGNNKLRESLQLVLIDIGFVLVSVIHPKAIVSPSAIVGKGTVIMAGAIVGTEATLGDGVIVNSGAIVDHHCTVEDYGHLGVGAAMAGGSRLGAGAWMQASSALGYGVQVKGGDVLQPGEAKA